MEIITKRLITIFQTRSFLDADEEQLHIEFEKIPNKKLMTLPDKIPV